MGKNYKELSRRDFLELAAAGAVSKTKTAGEIPGAKLIIVGKGSLEHQLKVMASKVNTSKSI